MSPQIRVGGVLLTSMWWGGLKVTRQWPRGCWQADWSMALGPTERPPYMVQGAPVEVLVGSRVVFAGYLSELGWDEGTFSASGVAREGEEVLCFAADGTTSSTPDVVIDAAIARGVISWSRPSSLSNVALTTGDDTEAQNYITDLLDTWSTTAGKRWAVNADRQVYAAADPTTPAYYIAYGAAEFGIADDALVGTLSGGWFDVNGAPHFTKVGAGRPEVAVNMADANVTDSTTATNILNAILVKTGARLAFTSAVTVDQSTVTSPGGVHPELHQITAGLMYRMVGLRDPRSGLPYTDVLMGESVWDVDAATVQLTPMDLAARDLSSIVADVGLELL
jgi:hypothetical protein